MVGRSRMKKKELEAGIRIKTVGKTVHLTFNEKLIIKAGTVTVNYDTETPDVSFNDWNIGYNIKWWMLFKKRSRKKQGCGILIEGGSVIISGESPDVIEVAEEG